MNTDKIKFPPLDQMMNPALTLIAIQRRLLMSISVLISWENISTSLYFEHLQ